MKVLNGIAYWLLVIGGLNWLCVAFGINVIDDIFGAGSTISMIIYILVGLSAIYEAVIYFRSDSAHAAVSAGSAM